MRGKYRRMLLKGTAALVAAAMLTGSVAYADSAGSAIMDRITTAWTLAKTDLPSNTPTIRTLLQMCLDELEPSDQMAQTLNSVLLLIDSGSGSSEAVTSLLESVMPTTDEAEQTEAAEPEESVVQETEPQETPAQETSAQESVVRETETQETEPQETPAQETSAQETAAQETEKRESKTGLPDFEVARFVKTILEKHVLLDVPGDWGNNESGRALTSYSPVNDSGAISPSAGTLSISYFPLDGAEANEAFDTFEENIAGMSVTTQSSSKDASAAGLPARSVDFTMQVGANEFTCETICFAYQNMVYAIELMQGPLTTYDFFPVYQQVVDSAEVGSEEEISEAKEKADAQTEAPEPETQPAPEPTPQPETQPSSEPSPQPETQPSPEPTPAPEPAPQPETQPTPEPTPAPEPAPQPETQPTPEPAPAPEPAPQPETQPSSESGGQSGMSADMGSFQYQLNGHLYQFPTPVWYISQEDFPVDKSKPLPYDYYSDADMTDGRWCEIINTQYFYMENSMYKEMAGVTNVLQKPATVADGVLSALIDTKGDTVNITLPGGVRVGSLESDILKGFPEFAQTGLDGYAAFRGNELLYARNVRDDGCNGYVLIRNDSPYYSAITIICENGVVREISFECLGSMRAAGIFQ